MARLFRDHAADGPEAFGDVHEIARFDLQLVWAFPKLGGDRGRFQAVVVAERSTCAKHSPTLTPGKFPKSGPSPAWCLCSAVSRGIPWAIESGEKSGPASSWARQQAGSGKS